MEGMALILSAVCINATFCPSQHADTSSNYGQSIFRNLKETSAAIEAEMATLAKDLKGRNLTVATLEDYPLSYTERNATVLGKGWAFEFFDYLSRKFDFKYHIVKPRYNIIGGTNDSDGSLMQMINQSKADIGVAFVPMLADLLQYVKFSTPLDEGEWKMIMVRPKESATGAGLLAPFDEIVWYFILVTLIVAGPAVFVIIWGYSRFGKHTGEPYYNLFQCIWFVYGGLMKQGSILSPNADSIRVAFATWWIYITILTSFYTANLTAFLTLARFSLPINVPRDMLEKNKGFISQKGFAVEYAIKNTDEELDLLKPMLEKNLATFTTMNNDTDILLNQVLKHNIVFLRDKPAIDHLVYEDYRKRKTELKERLQCPFAMSKEVSLRRKRSFIYPKDSTLPRLFDKHLRFMVEAGIIKHRLNHGLPRAEICPQNLGSTERQLRLNDLFTTYVTLLSGFSTAAVIFFIEIMMRYFNGKKGLQDSINRDQNIRRINVQPSIRTVRQHDSSKTISPPPAYGEAIKTIFNTQNSITEGKGGAVESYRTLNGRTYAVVKDESGTQLVPTRAPSAALFNYQMAYNSYK